MTVQEPTPGEDGADSDETGARDDRWFDPEAATFGDRLTGAREALGMTQAQLARRIGVRQSTLRKWEDDLSEPRANQLQMLSGILNVSLRWLLTADGEGVSAPESETVAAEDIRDLLRELREVRSDLIRNGERPVVLEKRLRRSLTAAA